MGAVDEPLAMWSDACAATKESGRAINGWVICQNVTKIQNILLNFQKSLAQCGVL